MKKFLILPVLLIPVICSAQSHGIDMTLLKDIVINRPQSLDHLFLLITKTAKPIVVLSFIIIFILGLIKKNRKLKLTSIQIVGGLIITTIIVVLLKHSVGRPRPYITDPTLWHAASKSNPSFPSGHTAVTFVVATILSLNYRRNYIGIMFFTWAILVAFSRLDLGMHYPSDVIAGAFIGFIISWTVYTIFLRIRKKYASPGIKPNSI